MDFGTQKKKNLEELRQCEKKIIVGTLNWWEWQEYIRSAQHYETSMEGEKIEYIVSLGNKKLVSKLEKKLRRRICFLGSQPIEEALPKEVEHFFNTLS